MTNELVIVTNVVSREITGLDVVNKVNELYSSVFNQLLLMLGVVATIVVVVLPVFFSIFQRRERRLQEAELKTENQKRFDELKTKLHKEAEAEIAAKTENFEKLLKEAEKRVEAKADLAHASAYHVQTVLCLDKGLYVEAIESAISAGQMYLDHGEIRRIQRLLNSLKTSLEKLRKNDFEENDHLSDLINNFFEEVIKKDHKEVLADEIEELKKLKKTAMQRS